MFNPIIVVAIIAQMIISRISRMAGAITGFVVTTGILLWGLSVYGNGGQISLFGLALSLPVFVLACLAWYGLDTYELLRARKGAGAEE